MVAGQRADGVDIELATAEGARGAPRLLLDAEADLGQIKVVNDDDADISDPGRGGYHDWDDGGYGDTDAMRAANARACQA